MKTKNLFNVILLFGVFSITFLQIQGCDSEDIITTPVSTDAYIKVLQASPNASGNPTNAYLDVYINGDGNLMINDLLYRNSSPSSGYTAINSGLKEIKATSQSDSNKVYLDTNYTFDVDVRYTIVMPGSISSLQQNTLIIVDTLTTPSSSHSRVRLIHGYDSNGEIVGNSEVDLHVSSTPDFEPSSSTRVGTFSFKDVSEYIEIPSGVTYYINITLPGQTGAGSKLVVGDLQVIAQDGKIYTVLLSGFTSAFGPDLTAFSDN